MYELEQSLGTARPMSTHQGPCLLSKEGEISLEKVQVPQNRVSLRKTVL